MAQPARRSYESPVEAVRLSPVPQPPDSANGIETARRLVRSLEQIARKGGTFSTGPEARAYGFLGGRHLSMSQIIQDSLWSFELSTTARNVLDHMTVHHDDHGIVTATQSKLAEHFGCSQSKISRAMSQLTAHHFTWKERRGQYRLNPLYSYRFGSRKHIRLLEEIGPEKLAEHAIVIPPARSEATR
ncbi:helix-turn-helix domain-containing protein [Streptomyces sp. NPDC051840]|uniref:helix-turn-helix domain-containing protein n=1 Tax=Streptomyces sp. NPDC051840 TaxID=3154752 RepID=UPI0034483E2F